MHSAPKIADAFAVNDPYSNNASFLTRSQVIQNKILDLARVERMQVKDTVNW